MRDVSFVDRVRAALEIAAIAPRWLTLEITESVMVSEREHSLHQLARLRRLGCRIAIDDFGTGYSSMAHLQRFSVDALKIDRSFITQLALNKESETIIRSLVALGKALNIETLAEGIEQEHELNLLQGERCDSGQGFLFARPLDAADTAHFLQSCVEGQTPAPDARREQDLPRHDGKGRSGRRRKSVTSSA
jgi:EAL domain-containing protein (putative c-di-GMP-specific phosphodiesterase class I)